MIKCLNFFIVFMVFLCFYSCKKYPESRLWFKNPKNIAFIDGHLTSYIVNGVDSIDYLNNYFYNDFNGNPYSHKFSDLKIWSQSIAKGYYEITIYKAEDYVSFSDITSGIQYSYIEKGKKLKLSGTKKMLEGFKKNIFISDEIVWDIIYLNKKKTKHKMKGTYNGNTYELQFN